MLVQNLSNVFGKSEIILNFSPHSFEKFGTNDAGIGFSENAGETVSDH